jgi:hypothetical protein
MSTPPLSGSIIEQPGDGSLSTPPPSSPGSIGVHSSHAAKLTWFRNYFRPHFNNWVFGPVDRLVRSEDALMGFIVMACSIDYLAGFWWGASTKYCTEKAYSGFIEKYFPPGRYDTAGLYDSLRNGLIHLFTIKGKKYALTHNTPTVHLKDAASGQVVLNANSFRDDLVAAKEKYFDAVEACPDLLDKVVDRYNRDGFLGVGGLEIL